MGTGTVRKILMVGGGLLAFWLGLRYLLPVLLPFLLGGLLALAAEPAVGFGTRRLRLPRGVAAGAGVSLTLVLLLSVLSLVGALAVRELGQLARALPDMQQTAQQGMMLIQDWLLNLAARMPEPAGNAVTGTVQELFHGGTFVMDQVTKQVPGVLKTVLSYLPGSALGIGTGILAGFMISARLPRLRQAIRRRLPEDWNTKYKPALRQLRSSIGGWLKAQLKLSAVTYGIVTVGFLLLGIAYGPLWALLVAVVDAVPILGTGTVLLPWAVVELLRGSRLRALGLVVIYGTALLSRTVLEPRLVGKQLGLDPLWTLVCLYAGFRFWGLLGMILAPMLAAAVKSLQQTKM